MSDEVKVEEVETAVAETNAGDDSSTELVSTDGGTEGDSGAVEAAVAEGPGTTSDNETVVKAEAEVVVDPKDFVFEMDGKTIQAQIPDSTVKYFADQGFNLGEIIQTVTKNGMKVPDDLYEKLSAKIPAPLLDLTISSYSDKVQNYLKSEADKATGQTNANTERLSALSELTGGEEGYKELEVWMLDSDAVSDGDIASYNAAMNSKDLGLQKLAVQNMVNKHRESNGDSLDTLIESTTETSVVDKTWLTKEEYHKVMQTTEYKADPQKFDAMRRRGHKRENI